MFLSWFFATVITYWVEHMNTEPDKKLALQLIRLSLRALGRTKGKTSLRKAVVPA